MSVAVEEERTKGILKLMRYCPSRHQLVLSSGEYKDKEGMKEILATRKDIGKLTRSCGVLFGFLQGD
jgi:hypothetical protein